MVVAVYAASGPASGGPAGSFVTARGEGENGMIRWSKSGGVWLLSAALLVALPAVGAERMVLGEYFTATW